MFSHPLFRSLFGLKGNARGCVYTEPLWGIPYNLYAPYVSVYMLALGLSDQQIGLIASIGLGFQIVAALLSGAITDKLGRRRTTFIFDILSWTIPTLIWAFSQNFTYFVVAAIVNSLWRVTMNSWTCLMVEDTDPDQLVDIYSWVYLSGLSVAFFAPIAGVLINQFSLVPTMRGLFIFASIMMTTKLIATNAWTQETTQGKLRMEQTRNQNIFHLLGEYSGVLSEILRSPKTLMTLGIMVIMSITNLVYTTFWSIYATEKLGIPTQDLSLYPFLRSVTMMFFFFIVMPKIKEMRVQRPMLVGFVAFILAQLVLFLTPPGNYWMLALNTFIEACSYATVSTLTDKMIVINVDAKERARIMSILYVVVISITTPFGWISGVLSQANRMYPFILSIVLFAFGGVLTYFALRHAKKQDQAETIPA